MEAIKNLKPLEKVIKILNIINILLEKTYTDNKRICVLSKNSITEIKNKQKLYDDKDIEKISSINKKYISIEDFDDYNIFYNKLYEFFLNKIYNFTTKKNNNNLITLFHTFNQAYYYKQLIKYISEFLNKYPESLKDDVIKEKLFEIIHSLESDDKLYLQDFYFYLSMRHIDYYYQHLDISLPQFEKLKGADDEIFNTEKTLEQIKAEKVLTIKDFIGYLKAFNPKNNIINELLNVKNKIEENIVFKNKNLDNIIWDKIITEEEKNLIKFLNENQLNNDVKELNEYLKNELELNEKFEFYFKNMMGSFLSLSKEDKYIIINSYNQKIEFYNQCLKFISTKNSYIEGIKNANNLKNNIKEIIEDKDFYYLIKDLLGSGKIVDYCKNPIQYVKDKNEIKTYYEKEEELSGLKGNKAEKNKKRDIKISTFNDKIEYDIENKGVPDLMDVPSSSNEDDEIFNEKEYKCRFEKNYDYFIKNVFNEKFLKERIIYSFLPYGIKGFVSFIPKIVLNICGNNI